MQEYLLITIDVEPDCSKTWHYSNPLTFYGVSIGIKEKLQPLFNKYNAKPTYLINNVVLDNDESVAIFKNLEGSFELGTHLHSEFIEPNAIKNPAGKKGEENQCFLQPDIEFEKLKNITSLFYNKMGYNPVSFRAGRFSAGSNTFESLIKLKYRVDSSVTPHVNWNDNTREMPVNYTNHPDQPYLIKSEKEEAELLQIPVSIIKNKKFLFLNRPLWLRPIFSTYNQYLRIIKNIRKSHPNTSTIVYNMMFHNVEVMAGLSPYTNNENECIAFLNSIEKLLKYCRENNIKFSTMSEIHSVYQKKKI